MPRIQILPDHVANQIAAGEVIERPASVIKELLENSLDAGAKRVEIEFKDGGRSYMRIEDDGCGMGRDDALLALERHATSKIRRAEDLDTLRSMGFRGEALPSIASVSRFQLQTREPETEGGCEVLVNAGKLIHVRDCGMPPGTRMTISHLFNSMPARRKFLKSDATESAHIVHCARLYALANPETAFSLLEDGRQIFSSPACSSLRDRVAEIFGRQLAKGLMPVEAREGELRLTGLIGMPGQSRSSRHEMLMFVNQRPVENRTLGYALIESYHGHIPKGRYPVAFLFLDLPPSQVDVNAHPAKREVRFRNETQVRGFAVRSILEALRKSLESVGAAAPLMAAPVAKPPPERAPLFKAPAAVQAPIQTPTKAPPPQTSAPQALPATPPAPARVPPAAPRSDWRFIGWHGGDLALFETGAGLALLDAKAALRRVWFERLRASYDRQSVESQGLLLPLPVEFDPIETTILTDNIDFLETYGLGVAPFGRNFFRLESVPTWLEEGEAEGYLREIVALLRSGSLSDRKPNAAIDTMAKLAAKKAVSRKAMPGDTELPKLLEQLFATANPLADLDGQPTFFELTRGEIDRRFHRGASAGAEY